MREVLYRHGLSRLHSCPREVCGLDETTDHVFWGCGFAKGVWDELVIFFSKVGNSVIPCVDVGFGFERNGKERVFVMVIAAYG